jgi:hypothetical protein
VGLEEDEHEPLLGQLGGRTQMRYGSQRMKGGVEEAEESGKFIHSSSYFGFLEQVPFRWGARGMRYQPSIADLQENPGKKDEDEIPTTSGPAKGKGKHRRKRSNTQTSGHTTDSLSSRGDIFPSEDEMDDAIAIDDEFAFDLGRRMGDETPGSSSNRRDTGQRSTSMLSILTIASGTSGGSKRKKNKKVSAKDDVLMSNVGEYPEEEEAELEHPMASPYEEYRISIPTSPRVLQRTSTSTSITSNPLERLPSREEELPATPIPSSSQPPIDTPPSPSSFNAAALPKFS